MSTTDRRLDRVRSFRGCLALCFAPQSPLLAALEHMIAQQSTAIPRAFERLPTEQWHVTLVTKAELRTLSAAAVAEATALAPSRVFPIGIGGSPARGVYFVVCMWPRAQSFRRKHGLPPQPFHVTLSTQNDHGVDKSVTSLLALDESSMWMEPLSMDALEAVARQLLLDNTERALRLALDVATHVCTAYSAQTTRGWLRLADAALELRKYKLAMLSYAHAHDKLGADDSSIDGDAVALQRRCLAQMQTCSGFTEWGHVFSEAECLEVPAPLFPFLVHQRWSHALRAAVRTRAHAADRVTASREKFWTVSCLSDRTARGAFYRLPRFFRWIVPFQLAAMSTPRNEQDIVHLARSVGIQHIVTLTREQPLERHWFPPLPQMIQNTHLAVTNYEAPSMAQIDLFIQRCCDCADSDAVAPVLVHCGGGKGRAGAMVACYLVAFGFQSPPARLDDWTQPALAADDAIRTLRAMRPGSIETEQQEAAVRAYSSLLWKRRSVLPVPVDEPLASAPVVIGKPLETTDLLVLCGLPGSGKTTFREMLVKRTAASRTQQQRNFVPWLELSGDEHGRESCERSIGRSGVQRAILDRVNGKADDRKAFLQLASTWSAHATAVWFDIPPDVCLYRAQQRPEHPTLSPGRRVANAIAQHAREFTPPDVAEGFATVVRITSRDAARALAQMLAPPIGLLRFPRTSHVINLGAATPDDLVMVDAPALSPSAPPPLPADSDSSRAQTDNGDVVVLTEKLDGANLGISLASDGCTLVVQNRSHYVTSASHFQFRKLDAYIHARRRVLRRILLQDPLVPERFILYGEWLAATHSIAYTKLQDLFYAFDLYDRVTQQFWDRRSLEALLAVTATEPLSGGSSSGGYSRDERIEIVPKLWSGPRLPDKDTLIAMARETPSQFYDGVIEGLYIKWEAPGRGVKHRGKVVRGDFITGNEHWTKGAIRLNTVVTHDSSSSA